MDFKVVSEEIEKNKKNHEKGYYNCIPFMGMDRLERFIPGIEQETYYLLTASSGVKEKQILHK